jgi:Tfp pilus assembly protein PilF
MGPHRARPSSSVPFFIACGCVVLATVWAYMPALSGPFVFDDMVEIARNGSTARLWPPTVPMFEGGKLPHRPLPYLSFAINRAIHGLDTRGYHLVNLAIHLANGWLIGWLVARGSQRAAPARFDAATARWLGLAVAAIWLLHPLCTQAVAYIYQRMESLGAMAILGTLACFEKSLESARPSRWRAAAVASSAAGMACKETVVVAPLLVLLYDLLIVHGGDFGGWRKSCRLSWRLYAALAATWLVLAGVVCLQSSRYSEFRDADNGAAAVGSMLYLLNQCPVLLHYLRLSIWPAGLCLDHDWPVNRSWIGLLPTFAAITAVFAVAIGIARRFPGIAFLMLGWFLLLAPTSSVIPVADLCVEHRMYLPLAMFVTLAVLALDAAASWIAAGGRRTALLVAGAAAVALPLVVATHTRAADYASRIGIWQDTVLKAPHNPRAWLSVGWIVLGSGDERRAETLIGEALKRRPDYADALFQMGNAVRSRDPAAAVEWYRRSLAIRPDEINCRNNLAALLGMRNDPSAEDHLRVVLTADPNNVEALCNYGNLLLGRGEIDAARGLFAKAVALNPADELARRNLQAVGATRRPAAQP